MLINELNSTSTKLTSRCDRVGGLRIAGLLSRISQADPKPYTIAEQVEDGMISLRSDTTYADLVCGADLMNSGRVAIVVIVGDQRNSSGELIALAKLPGSGMSLLVHKVSQASQFKKAPLWIMASAATFGEVAACLTTIAPQPNACLFEQFETFALTPMNELLRDNNDNPVLCGTGTGDLGPSLIDEGLLAEYPEVEHVLVIDCLNLKATVDLAMLGIHSRANDEYAVKVTCELVPRDQHDPSRVPAIVDGDNLQIVEFGRANELLNDAKYTATGTMIVGRMALEKGMPWRWNYVPFHLTNAVGVRIERSLFQYTECFRTKFVLYNREQRYMPVNDEASTLAAAKMLDGNELFNVQPR